MRIKNIEIKFANEDIVKLDVDAIVIPANMRLEMENDLARKVKEKGGGAIEEEALSKAPVDIGEAIVTKAGKLKARHIIHAVVEGTEGNTGQETVRHAAASALNRALELKLKSLSMTALGFGLGGFPLVGSAKIITQEILRISRQKEISLEEMVFCLGPKTFEVFESTVCGYVRHIQEDLGPGPYVTVDIIIECREGIILIERSNPPYGWALPGGFLDYGESLEQAAIREAKEETDLDLINLRQLHTYSEPGRDPRFQTVSTVFVAEGLGRPKPGDDAKNLKIVRFEDLPELDYAFDHKKIIKEYLIERTLD